MTDTLPAAKPPVWSGDWSIPKVVKLPGARVTVRLVPQEEVEKAGCLYGVFTYAPPTYEKPSAIIRINKDLPVEVQRYTLVHELQHALVELLDVMVEKFPESVQSASMWALVNAKAAEMVKLVTDEKGDGSVDKM